MKNKDELRQSIRTLRKNLSQNIVTDTAKKITQKIIQLPEFIAAKNIAYYISHENEVDPSLIAAHARQLNKNLYLPFFSNNKTLDFYLIGKNTKFTKNKFDTFEPIIKNQKPISPQQLDLMLIPLVAFDKNLNRLGRGAGAYDRYLSFTKNTTKKPFLIGLAYAFQEVENIVSEDWDVKMDCVIAL
jgi:5-formyltetrahydrofolate cyclo-ligase